MNQAAPADNFQVTLSGRRLSPISDAILLGRLQETFGITLEQAAQLLGGPLIVRQCLDLKLAAKVASGFRACGLEALVEAMEGSTPAPPAAEPPRQTPDPAREATVLQALQALGDHPIPAQPTDARYRRGLLLATAGCVLIPLLYLGFTAAVAVAWLSYLGGAAGQSVTTLLFAYAVPGLIGLALILLLLKPLLVRSPAAAEPIPLPAHEEPDFVSGIEALCSAISVDPPQEIQLNCEVYAAVHFRGGWRGLLKGDKVLTIGMPLLAGLSARELTGVLAHEFGHCARPADMRSYFLINKVNAWLENRAYEPDAWDERLERWHEQSEQAAVQAAAQAAAVGIRLTRQLLAGLFRLSQRLTRHTSQQMEFDADRYAAVVAGSDQFRLTARSLRALAQAADEVQAANLVSWQEGRLLKDVPQAIATQYRGTDAESLKAIEAEMQEESTRYWDAHPADAERIARAESLQAPGYFPGAEPARLLLRSFEQRCQQATEALYRQQGISYAAEQLHAPQDVRAAGDARDAQRETLERFFNGQFRPWPLLHLAVAADVELTAQGWQGAIDTLRRRSPEMTQDWAAAAELEQRRPRLLLAASLGLKPSQFGISGMDDLTREQLWNVLAQIRARSSQAHHQLAQDLQLHAYRIDCAINALRDEERLQAEFLRTLLQRLYDLQADAAALAELQAAAGPLQRYAADGEHPDAKKDLDEALRVFRGHAHRLIEGGKNVAQAVADGGTVSGYLLLRCPLAGPERTTDGPGYLRDAQGFAEAFLQLYQLSLGALVTLCETAERANGIKPIRRVERC